MKKSLINASQRRYSLLLLKCLAQNHEMKEERTSKKSESQFTLQLLEFITSQVVKKGPPAGVWHHKSRRLNYQHLTKHPRSLGTLSMGTKDVSFLYDPKSAEKRPPNNVESLPKIKGSLEVDETSLLISLSSCFCSQSQS